MEEQNSNNNNDYFSLPLATMTFGKEQLANFTFNNNSFNNNNYTLKNDNNNNLTLKNNNNFANIIQENKNESSNGNINNNNLNNTNEEIQIEKNSKKNFPHLTTFQNKINSYNSFIPPILYAIYYMKIIRNYILNEVQIQNDKNSLLYHLKKILSLMPENKKIDLSQFRNCLSENFQNRRKFLLDNPDDPSDLYFILINSIHSNFLNCPQKEISDYSCREKCISHHFLWLDIARIDFCDCGLSSKRLFSNHNYIFDINLDKIFEVMKTLKERNNNIHNNNFSLYDYYGKLFYFYKLLMNYIQSDCPVNGMRCNVNKTHKKLILNNNPSYLVFSFPQKLNYSILDMLKIFILIPKNLELSNLFDISNQNGKNNSMSFNLFGYVLFKNSKNFSSVFKDHHSCSWLYYDDDNVFSFNNFFEVICYCLKNAIYPIMLFYKSSLISKSNNNDMFNAINDDISLEQCNFLEKYALSADSLMKYLDNKIRINEDFLGTFSHISHNNNNNIKGNNPSKISHNNMNNLNKDFYICANCQNKNKISDKFCQKCGYNNLENLSSRQIDNKILNYSPIKIQNLNQNPSKNNPFINNINNGSLNHPNILPIALNNNNSNNITQNSNSNTKKKKNLITEEEEENIDPRMKKYYDMPKPYIPKKEGPVMIKSKNINNNLTNNNQLKNKNSAQNEINFTHSNTNPNDENENNFNNQGINNKKKQKENKIVYNNENEDRIIPYEMIQSKKRAGSSKNSFNENKNNSNKIGNAIQEMKLNSHLFIMNNNSNSHLSSFWNCPNCNNNNSHSNIKCKYCNYHMKKKENKKDNRISTPIVTHQKLLEKKQSNKNFERKYSEKKYVRIDSKSKSKSKSKSNDKKNLRNSHGKSPNGLYFVSGNNNLNKPINNNGRISTSNVSVNLGIKSSDSIHSNNNNFKRKKNNYKYNK